VNERTHLDLFSGIGGFALAAKWNGFRTVGFCDNEPYAQAVLKKHWPDVPIHDDIRKVRGELYAGVTLLTGGFPCQPFSVAGKQRGKTDDRYLWPEMLRVIREARPAWIVGENVAGIVNMALDQVHVDLEAESYEVESLIIPACAVDAPHRSDRVWIIARDLADSVSVSEGSTHGSKERKCERGWEEQDISQRNKVGGNPSNCGKDVADTNGGQFSKCESERKSVQMLGEGSQRVCDVADTSSKGSQGTKLRSTSSQSSRASRSTSQRLGSNWATWLPEPDVGRVAHGIPNRVAKLRGLGNAIVPQVAAEIIRCIVEVSK
jgi:DNA (cytosine-5)-methyltransferase 1